MTLARTAQVKLFMPLKFSIKSKVPNRIFVQTVMNHMHNEEDFTIMSDDSTINMADLENTLTYTLTGNNDDNKVDLNTVADLCSEITKFCETTKVNK